MRWFWITLIGFIGAGCTHQRAPAQEKSAPSLHEVPDTIPPLDKAALEEVKQNLVSEYEQIAPTLTNTNSRS